MLLWASITGVAATVVIILVLRAMMISSQPEIIQVFQANHVAQQVTLQVNDEKEVKPLKEVVESFSSSSAAQLSSKEIDYSRALLQTETRKWESRIQIHRLSIPRRDIQSCFIRRNRSLLEFRQPIENTLRFLKEKKESSLWKGVKLILKLLKMQNILLL